MGIRTKIVATLGGERTMLGPDDQTLVRDVSYLEMIPWLVDAGVDVFRLNMSHLSEEGAAERRFLDAYRDTRFLWEGRGRHVAVLGDLQGPKIRTGSHTASPDDTVELVPGEEFVLHTREAVIGSKNQATVYYNDEPFAEMTERVAVSLRDRGGASEQKIWFGDGESLLIAQRVSERDGTIACRIRSGGTIKGRRGVTAEGVSFNRVECFTDKDKDDLRFLLTFGDELTYVAMSFVRTAEDILKVRYFIDQECRRKGIPREQIPVRTPGLIAKIETQEAVDDIDDILDVADGVMMARGDLGMQIGLKNVAGAQKQVIHRCNVRGKPVITATQMLDSMERNPIPTRAEVTDVYNAIADGSDAVMLSGETSKGPYPIQAIKVMCGIAEQAEHDLLEAPKGRFPKAEDRFLNLLREAEEDLPVAQARVKKKIKKYKDAQGAEEKYYCEEYRDVQRLLETQKTTDRVSHAACSLSVGVEVSAIMAPSTSGQTTRMVARFRPVAPIIGAAHDYCVARKLTLCFGVYPINILRTQKSNEDVFKAGCDKAKSLIRREAGRGARDQQVRPLVRKGDQIVITAGFPLYRRGTTNLVKLHTVDDEEG